MSIRNFSACVTALSQNQPPTLAYTVGYAFLWCEPEGAYQGRWADLRKGNGQVQQKWTRKRRDPPPRLLRWCQASIDSGMVQASAGYLARLRNIESCVRMKSLSRKDLNAARC